MAQDNVSKECVKCGSIKIKGKWYQPRRAPAHAPVYKGAICDDCQRKKDEASTDNSSSVQTKNPLSLQGTITKGNGSRAPGAKW
jgi:NMD protein affecting ribosome stability and mRNA decay